MGSDLDLALLLGAAVVLVGVLAVRVSARLGLPGLLLYLGLGLLLGEAGVGIAFDDAALARDLGLVALVVILAEGGLTTRLSTIRPVLGLSVTLATVGVAVSVAVVALAVHLVLGMDARTSVLIGAVLSSTDAAAVFSVLRRLKLRPRISATLEAESGLNDAPVIVLVSLVASGEWGHHPWWYELGVVVYELLAGAAFGIVVGLIGRWLLVRLALPAVGLYPLASLALIVGAYAVAGLAHASGFLAVYVCAVLLGSSRLPHRRSVLGFTEGLAWLAQIGLFVLLGLLASPQRLSDAIPLALVAGIALVLAGRPLAVLVSATPFRIPWSEQFFLTVAGLRGAVPIVLATIALAAGTAGSVEVFDATFLLVLVLTALQAPPLPWIARRLRVAGASEAGELAVESAPLDEMNAALLEVEVPAGSKMVGLYVDPDLRLPVGASVTLVVREGATMVPDRLTRIREGDRLLVVTTATVRRDAERRLRAVSRGGPVAGWFGEKGDPD
jgi:potassium/hydrogen antiporter